MKTTQKTEVPPAPALGSTGADESKPLRTTLEITATTPEPPVKPKPERPASAAIPRRIELIYSRAAALRFLCKERLTPLLDQLIHVDSEIPSFRVIDHVSNLGFLLNSQTCIDFVAASVVLTALEATPEYQEAARMCEPILAQEAEEAAAAKAAYEASVAKLRDYRERAEQVTKQAIETALNDPAVIEQGKAVQDEEEQARAHLETYTRRSELLAGRV